MEITDTTSSCSYLKYGSAHPKYVYKGIVKSQMNSLRRLCSRDSDFVDAVKDLEIRCLNSGYKKEMITEILNSANSLSRNLVSAAAPTVNNISIVRLVTLADSFYERKFTNFVSRMNGILLSSNIQIVIVKCTSAPISRLLFNNGNSRSNLNVPFNDGCIACSNNIINDTGVIKSNVTGTLFKIETNLNCGNGGIYVINGACSAQYTGKTIHFGVRAKEHFRYKSTAIYSHIQNCDVCKSVSDFKLTFVENYLKRGKYSLSEREFLWNNRIRGSINTHKTLGN